MDRPENLWDQLIALWIHEARMYFTLYPDGGNLTTALIDGHLDDDTLNTLQEVCKALRDRKGHEVALLMSTYPEDQREYMYKTYREDYTKPYKFPR